MGAPQEKSTRQSPAPAPRPTTHRGTPRLRPNERYPGSRPTPRPPKPTDHAQIPNAPRAGQPHTTAQRTPRAASTGLEKLKEEASDTRRSNRSSPTEKNPTKNVGRHRKSRQRPDHRLGSHTQHP